MKTHFDSRYAHSPSEVKQMVTADLRKNFLISQLFEPDNIYLTLTHYDRYITGGVMPVSGAVALSNPDYLKAAYFLE